jgi:hypothetical protein
MAVHGEEVEADGEYDECDDDSSNDINCVNHLIIIIKANII